MTNETPFKNLHQAEGKTGGGVRELGHLCTQTVLLIVHSKDQDTQYWKCEAINIMENVQNTSIDTGRCLSV